jgi:tetratricopeptide (TPR) repeat protein
MYAMVTSLFRLAWKQNKRLQEGNLQGNDMILTVQEYYKRGTAPVYVGRYADAIKCFDNTLERVPRYKEVLVALVAAADGLGLFQEAVLSCDFGAGRRIPVM